MLDVCIIGASGHYNYILDVYNNNSKFRITAISKGVECENILNLAKTLKLINSNIRVYDNYKNLLENEKANICIVNTVFSEQASISIRALEKGMHVFSEKPLATNIEDLKNLRKIQEKTKKNICAMFGIRYTSHFLTAKKIIEEDGIGKIKMMNTQKSYKLGERLDFYKKRKTYGGTILWVGSHAMDWCRWISGEEYINVFALHSRSDNHHHGDLENAAICTFEMTNEVFTSIIIDYLRPVNSITHDDDRLRIVGTKGILEIRNEEVYLNNEFNNGEIPMKKVQDRSIFFDFIKEIRGEGSCMVSTKDSFEIAYTAIVALKSADTGKKMEVAKFYE